MKNNQKTYQTLRLLTVASLLVMNSSAFSAVSELADQQNGQKSFLNNDLSSSSSILESLQQSKVDEKKTGYLEVLELIKQNKLKEAREKNALLLKKYPNLSSFFNLQALLETLEKNTPQAIENYKKALQINPKDLLAHLGLAKLHLESGQLDQAKELANKTLAIDDKALNAYLLLADVAYKQKNNNEVENILLKANEKVQGNVKAQIEITKNLSKFYTLEKKYDKILALAETLTKSYPNNTEAMSILAGAQIINNKKDLAEATLRQIINTDKQDIAHRLLLVKMLNDQSGKESDALKLLDEAYAIAPNNPDVLVFKTAFLTKLKRYPEAYEFANKADTQFPAQPFGKILKGDIALAERKFDKATDYYQQAYKVQPNTKVLFVLTDLLASQKKQSEAMSLLNKALEKEPKNSSIHLKLATLYQQQNDFAQAETHYQTILSAQPDNVLALNNLAWIYQQQNNPKAVELSQKAYNAAPEAASVVDTHGYVLLKTGKAADALPILEKAAKLAPNMASIQYHLAEAYAATDNKSKAIELLETITKSEQNYAEKTEALALLEKLKMQ